jgi:hypothetical protein
MIAPAKCARSPSPEQSTNVADRGGVKERVRTGAEQHLVGGALEGRRVVRLREDPGEDEMRLAEAVERAQAIEQLVGDAVHDLHVLAADVGVQAAEVGDAGGGAHAAEKAVALDEERLRAAARRRGRRGEPRGSAAEDDDIELAEDRGRSRRLGDGAH